jgi:SAM-dependent methyltransferase
MITVSLILLTLTLDGEQSLFAPTQLDVVQEMLKLAEITPQDKVYDLGCGDGRVVILASKTFKCKSVGIDIDKYCVDLSNRNVELNKMQDLVSIRHENVLKSDFQDATIIFVYLMPNLSKRLVQKFQNLPKGTKVIAHDKPIPGLEPLIVRSMVSKYDKKEHFIYIWQHP